MFKESLSSSPIQDYLYDSVRGTKALCKVLIAGLSDLVNLRLKLVDAKRLHETTSLVRKWT